MNKLFFHPSETNIWQWGGGGGFINAGTGWHHHLVASLEEKYGKGRITCNIILAGLLGVKYDKGELK